MVPKGVELDLWNIVLSMAEKGSVAFAAGIDAFFLKWGTCNSRASKAEVSIIDSRVETGSDICLPVSNHLSPHEELLTRQVRGNLSAEVKARLEKGKVQGRYSQAVLNDWFSRCVTQKLSSARVCMNEGAAPLIAFNEIFNESSTTGYTIAHDNSGHISQPHEMVRT